MPEEPARSSVVFPSLGFVKALQEKLNEDAAFKTATKWSDCKVLLDFGGKRYWMKLYGGKVIDVLEYSPAAVPVGWDFSIGAPLEVWMGLLDGSKCSQSTFGDDIVVDGNLLEAHRMWEAVWIIYEAIQFIPSEQRTGTQYR